MPCEGFWVRMRRLFYNYLVMIDGSLVVSLLGLDVAHIHE